MDFVWGNVFAYGYLYIVGSALEFLCLHGDPPLSSFESLIHLEEGVFNWGVSWRNVHAGGHQ